MRQCKFLSMMEERHLYWLAGLIEGEGSFYFGGGQLRVSVTSTDKDTLTSALERSGMGYINGPYKQAKEEWSDYWVWTVGKSHDTYAILIMLWPLLHERRREQVSKVVAEWLAIPLSGKYKTHCKNGHPFSEENTAVYDYGQGPRRKCMQCSREKSARYRQRQLDLMRETV